MYTMCNLLDIRFYISNRHILLSVREIFDTFVYLDNVIIVEDTYIRNKYSVAIHSLIINSFIIYISQKRTYAIAMITLPNPCTQECALDLSVKTSTFICNFTTKFMH